MPHRRVDLLAFARRQPSRRMLRVVALLSIAASCRGAESDATVIVPDSSSRRDSLEVVDRTVDSASRQPQVAPGARAPTAADSIAALDARFQQERAVLNAEARALQSGDRHSTEYAERFDAWHRRAVAADSVRVLRDKLRARAAPVGAP